MTTITINEKTAKGKSLIQFLKTNFSGENFILFEDQVKPNKEVLESFQDAINGKVIKYSSAKEMAKTLKKKAGV
jgi:hypothetical protein